MSGDFFLDGHSLQMMTFNCDAHSDLFIMGPSSGKQSTIFTQDILKFDIDDPLRIQSNILLIISQRQPHCFVGGCKLQSAYHSPPPLRLGNIY